MRALSGYWNLVDNRCVEAINYDAVVVVVAVVAAVEYFGRLQYDLKTVIYVAVVVADVVAAAVSVVDVAAVVAMWAVEIPVHLTYCS